MCSDERYKCTLSLSNREYSIMTTTLTPGEEHADHEAEVNGRYGKNQQEDEHQRGVTVGQHRSVRTHLIENKTQVTNMCMAKLAN